MKKIQKIIASIVLILLPLLGQAQESAIQKWVQSFEGKPGLTIVSISPAMFRMLSRVKSSDPGYQDIARFSAKLKTFKIVVADGDEKMNAKVTADLNRLISLAPLQHFEELMSINEGKNKIEFHVQEEADHIKELLMRITGNEQVVMFIKGDFKLNELTDISGDVNITGINKVQKLKK